MSLLCVENAGQRRGNLPAEVTSFVGRQHEIGQAIRLLSTTRLLTLTGVGGVGKTRLALRIAAAQQRSFPHGVWLVELAHLHDQELVVHTITQALNIFTQTSQEPVELLINFLRDRQLLLILDNCEHLLDTCAVLTRKMLASLPELRILITSRQALRVEGEHILTVPPLPVPDPQQPPSDTSAHHAALTLFAERAAAVVPTFALTPDNQTHITTICHRLDGIPLAIEFAAARLRALSVKQLLSRLDSQYQLLITGPRLAPLRHRTLQAAIDWSYHLCSPEEQLLWTRLAVFPGEFDLEGIKHVCAGQDLPPEGIIQLVQGLIDKSIFTRRDGSYGLRARYHLLDTIRQYGRDKLSDTDQYTARRRHADWYLRLAEQGEREWFGPDQLAWLQRLRQEHANFRAALEFFLTSAQPHTGLRLASALWFYWPHASSCAEGRRWLERTLALDTQPTRHRAKALWATGYIAVVQGDCTAASPLLDQARDLATQLGDATTLARTTNRLGIVAMLNGDLDRTARLLEQALAQFRSLEQPDDASMAMTLMLLGGTRTLQGNLPAAVEFCQQARAICEAHGDHTYLAYALSILARAEWVMGELEKAIAHTGESLRLRRNTPDPPNLILSIEQLAWITAAAGEYERTAVLLGAAHQGALDFGLSELLDSAAFADQHRECQTQARHALGDSAFEAAFHHGTTLTLDQIITYGLRETRPKEITHPSPAAPATPGKPPAGPLTRREHQVAELVAQGLANKDIAAQLVIAQRTAEGHVQHILAKLGLNSRTQLAVWITQQQREDQGQSQ